MDLEQKVTGALTAELQRQPESKDGKLQVGAAQNDLPSLNRSIDLEELAMPLPAPSPAAHELGHAG